MDNWVELGRLSPRALCDARLRAHCAAQWLARIARSYLPAGEDDSHADLIWRDDAASPLEPSPEFHSAPHIRLGAPFSASVPVVGEHLIAAYAPLVHKIWLGAEGRPNNVVVLQGKTDDEIVSLLPQLLQSLGAEADRFSSILPYAPPSAPDNDPPEAEAAAELARYYANFNRLLTELAGRYRPIGGVRINARTLEISRPFTVAENEGDKTRATTVGLIPGDDGCDQPYLFIAPRGAHRTRTPPSPPAGLRWRDSSRPVLVAMAEDIMIGADARARIETAIDDGIAYLRSV